MLPPNYEFIPLNPQSKIPFEGWTTDAALPEAAAVQILRQGGNYGVRLRDTDVVIDIDPRNGGHEKMLGELPLCPRVATPSGGWHLYFTKPAELPIRETLAEWPGIEFKSKGRQVVGPHSIHPDFPRGPRYKWDDLLSGPFPAPVLPFHILARITVTSPRVSNNGVGDWSPEMLTRALDQLDITKFDTNETWFPLLCAAHAATGGAGVDEFLRWSLGDDLFAQDSGIIRKRWESLSTDKTLIAGAGTLKHILLQHGVKDIADIHGNAAEDFAKFANNAEVLDSRRPVIKIKGGSLPANIIAAERELANTGIYQRGGLLVRLARLAATTESRGIARSAGTLQILPVNADVLRMRLGECITWARYDERKKEWVKTDTPLPVAKTLVDLPGQWPNVPALNGIVETPALRVDGTILDAPGYDASGLYFDPGDTIFSSVPATPTREDAEAALDKLLAIVKGFPFSDEFGLAVAVAMLLTPLIRFAVRAAPMFVISAPKMGSGKTLLAHLPSYIATGRPPALMSQPDSPEEERKRLLALLSEGSAITVIDNIERPLKSDVLCTVLTEPVIRDRLLGVSRTITVPTTTTWIATGNNIRIDGDLTSRCLLCKLDPGCERPEERRFMVNLHEAVPAKRAELAQAALTIVAAHRAAGTPDSGLTTYGRFEDWSALVRAPLVWLGMADPCGSRSAIESRDPIRDNLGNLLESWFESFGFAPQTLSTVLQLVLGDMAGEYEELRSAIFTVAEERGKMSARMLGNFIARHEKRIERGLKFERTGERKHAVLWGIQSEL